MYLLSAHFESAYHYLKDWSLQPLLDYDRNGKVTVCAAEPIRQITVHSNIGYFTKEYASIAPFTGIRDILKHRVSINIEKLLGKDINDFESLTEEEELAEQEFKTAMHKLEFYSRKEGLL